MIPDRLGAWEVVGARPTHEAAPHPFPLPHWGERVAGGRVRGRLMVREQEPTDEPAREDARPTENANCTTTEACPTSNERGL